MERGQYLVADAPPLRRLSVREVPQVGLRAGAGHLLHRPVVAGAVGHLIPIREAGEPAALRRRARLGEVQVALPLEVRPERVPAVPGTWVCELLEAAFRRPPDGLHDHLLLDARLLHFLRFQCALAAVADVVFHEDGADAVGGLGDELAVASGEAVSPIVAQAALRDGAQETESEVDQGSAAEPAGGLGLVEPAHVHVEERPNDALDGERRVPGVLVVAEDLGGDVEVLDDAGGMLIDVAQVVGLLGEELDRVHCILVQHVSVVRWWRL